MGLTRLFEGLAGSTSWADEFGSTSWVDELEPRILELRSPRPALNTIEDPFTDKLVLWWGREAGLPRATLRALAPTLLLTLLISPLRAGGSKPGAAGLVSGESWGPEPAWLCLWVAHVFLFFFWVPQWGFHPDRLQSGERSNCFCHLCMMRGSGG